MNKKNKKTQGCDFSFLDWLKGREKKIQVIQNVTMTDQRLLNRMIIIMEMQENEKHSSDSGDDNAWTLEC